MKVVAVVVEKGLFVYLFGGSSVAAAAETFTASLVALVCANFLDTLRKNVERSY